MFWISNTFMLGITISFPRSAWERLTLCVLSSLRLNNQIERLLITEDCQRDRGFGWERFEEAIPLLRRLSGDSVYDVLTRAAEAHRDRVALRMIMTGADDEQTRRVSFGELLGLVRQTANLFSGLSGARPGVAYCFRL